MMATAPSVPLTVTGVPKSVDKKVDEIVSFDELLAEYEQVPVLEELATYVRSAFDEACSHRATTEAEQDMERAIRAWASKYDPDDIANLGITPGTDVFLPITNLKCRALRSWLHDILANAEDKPWTLKATPDPELPPDAVEAVVDALEAEIQDRGFNIDLRARAAYYKDLAKKHVDHLVERATSRMETRIEDTMIEGGWRTTFSQLMADVAVFPTAFIKGPVVEREPGLRWYKSKLRRVERLRYKVKRVHPLDIFPSPSSTSTQDGAYIIERVRLRYAQLYDLAKVPGYIEDAIRSVLAAQPAGVSEDVASDESIEEQAQTEESSAAIEAPVVKDFEAVAYYGLVPGALLIPYGVDRIKDPQAAVEAEVWTCNDVVIRAILNPHPLGRRPFYGTSFETIPGSVWGRGLPQILRDTQRIANSAGRSLVKNMAFSSGPVGEYDVDRLASEENIEDVAPYRFYAVQNDSYQPSNSPAMRFNTIPSVAKELLMVQDRYSKIADDISGIPAYVVGNPQTAGAGRTLGGLSLLMGNAAKGIKLVISNIDRDIIEPVVHAFYIMHMLFEEDETLKADASVLARGAAGLLQRELMQARSIEVLTMLTPYASAGLVPKPGLQNVLRDVLRGLGYTADEIVPDPERQAQLAALASQLGARQNQALAGMSRPPTPGAPPSSAQQPPRLPQTLPAFATPQLDGRSTPRPGPDLAERIPPQPE